MTKEMYIALQCDCYDCLAFDREKQVRENVIGFNREDAMRNALVKGWKEFSGYGVVRHYAPGHTPPAGVRRAMSRGRI